MLDSGFPFFFFVHDVFGTMVSGTSKEIIIRSFVDLAW